MGQTTAKALQVPHPTIAGLQQTQDVVVPDASNPSFATVTLTNNLVESAQDTMTALAGGAQAGTAITAMLSRFTTVATGGDSAQLPAAKAGWSYTVKNDHASNSMNVFPQTGESINALSANAAFAVAAGKSVYFYCVTAGKWHTILSA